LADYKKRAWGKLFDPAKTYAVVQGKGTPNKLKQQITHTIREELYILAASQLWHEGRRSCAQVMLPQNVCSGRSTYVMANTKNDFHTAGWSLSQWHDLTIDRQWKQMAKACFFEKLLKVLNGKIHVESAWRADLRRAAILVGKSLVSSDIPSSFLWNMIALEVLLTKRGEKHSQELPARIEAFFGWVPFWADRKFRANISRAYRLRCSLVHDGNTEGISKRDIVFTDELLFNLLCILLRHTRMFASKRNVIDFAKRVEAERFLGIRPKVRPKTFLYHSRRYSRDDLAP